MKIHIAKCIGDVKIAEDFVKKYEIVDEYMYNIYTMIPYSGTMKVEMNIDLIKEEKNGKQEIKINEYSLTPLGFIKSVVDRFKYEYNEITFKQWTKYYNPFEDK